MALFYDITTTEQLAALNYILTQIDIRLGYLAADGITPTPKIGVSAWQEAGKGCPIVDPSVGQTLHWTKLNPHPTVSGRHALFVDTHVVFEINHVIATIQALSSPTAGQTVILNVLTSLTPVALDSSWGATQ